MRDRNASKAALQVELSEGRIPPSITLTSAVVAPKTGEVTVTGKTTPYNFIYAYLQQRIGRTGSKAVSACGFAITSDNGDFSVTLTPAVGKFVGGGARIDAYDWDTAESLPLQPARLTG